MTTFLERTTTSAAVSAPSYASGASDLPLLGETIGENLDRTVARLGDREALVDCASGRRWTYRSWSPTSTRSRTACWPSASPRATGSASGPPTVPSGRSCSTPPRRVGAILVNINPAYRSHELAYVLDQSGVPLLVAAPSVQDHDYRRWSTRSGRDCPDLREAIYIGTPTWTR